MEQIAGLIAAAVAMRTLYPANHPRVIQAVGQIIAALRGSVTFLLVGDDLVVEQEVVRNLSLPQRHFMQALKRRGIERLTLAEGLDIEECHAFIATLACGTDSPVRPADGLENPSHIESTAHLIVGRVHVAFDDEKKDGDENAPRELSVDQIDVVREAFARFRIDGKIPLGEMEQLVWSFIDSISRTTRGVLPLAKLKEHDEYTFIHSVNVSLLVLAQARSFGIGGVMLHTFGMAALLHDIGKLMVPISVLNKAGKLEGDDWNVMKSHAERGAWYLTELEGAAPLTISVAYEHHLRYDGEPNYPLLTTPRIPNLASRMTSIADAYDAMSTVRPYQQPKLRASALELLKSRAETFYDPLLVANFVSLVASSG
ncbi:MAG: HD domain-containing phosphohydrolase [Acidobacteriota bacterium]